MNRTIKITFSFTISAVFLVIAFWNVDFGNFYVSLKKTPWSIVLVVSLMAIINMFIRAWRWRILLKSLKRIPYNSVFSFTMIGFMANNVLPAHAGELVRALLIGKREEISGIAVMTTILIERLFDFITLMLMLLFVLTLIAVPSWLNNGGLLIGGVSLVAILLLIGLAADQERSMRFFSRFTAKFPAGFRSKIEKKLTSFLVGLEILKDRKNSFKILLISLLLWAQMAATVFIILWGFPFDRALNINFGLAATTVVVFLAFAVTIPSSPGYFGVTQLAFIIALGLFSINKSDALTCSIIFNLTQYIPVTALGIIYLLKEGLSFGELAARTES